MDYKRIRGRLVLESLDLIEECRKSNSRYQPCDTGLETEKCKLGVARTFLAWEKITCELLLRGKVT